MAADQSTLPALPEQDGVEFRHCPGLPGYCVGDDGTYWSARCNGAITDRWRHIGGFLSVYGYRCVTVRIKGKDVIRRIHRLILEAFIGPAPENHVARHLDGNKTNNSLKNLVWGTFTENLEDAYAHGVQAQGSASHCARLTEQQVHEILDLLEAGGLTHKQIGERYSVVKRTIWAIATGQAWKVAQMSWLNSRLERSRRRADALEAALRRLVETRSVEAWDEARRVLAEEG